MGELAHPRKRTGPKPTNGMMSLMLKFLKHPRLLKIVLLLLLGLIFLTYLRPEMMVDMANTLLVLCGW